MRRAPLCCLLLPTIISFPSYQRKSRGLARGGGGNIRAGSFASSHIDRVRETSCVKTDICRRSPTQSEQEMTERGTTPPDLPSGYYFPSLSLSLGGVPFTVVGARRRVASCFLDLFVFMTSLYEVRGKGRPYQKQSTFPVVRFNTL